MEGKMSRGKRDSQWLVIRRCLSLIRRVQRGPAAWQELVQSVLEQLGPDAYGGTRGKALHSRLENDLARIRDRLMVDLGFDRQAGGYAIREAWLPLLDLPDEDLATVAWLEQTFDPGSPQHDEVHALLGRLRLFLSPQRRDVIERCRTALVVDLAQRDEDDIPPAVWDGLTRALVERRRIAFSYRSPQQEDRVPRRHVVDPYERFFDTVRGHYYLRGWCHVTDGPLGRREQGRYFTYRLGRIAALEVLPNKLPPFPPSTPRYAVAYELTPQVARLGVTRHREIEIAEVEQQEDGSAVVRGTTDNPFWTVRTLLHYGPNCRVLGGPEMKREMRQVIQQMAALYP
jgi:predicted DNA-binding transcriptional regulator YafY